MLDVLHKSIKMTEHVLLGIAASSTMILKCYFTIIVIVIYIFSSLLIRNKSWKCTHTAQLNVLILKRTSKRLCQRAAGFFKNLIWLTLSEFSDGVEKCSVKSAVNCLWPFLIFSGKTLRKVTFQFIVDDCTTERKRNAWLVKLCKHRKVAPFKKSVRFYTDVVD